MQPTKRRRGRSAPGAARRAGAASRSAEAEERARLAEEALEAVQRREEALRLQNEHLIDAVRTMEEMLARYADQYEEAPIGFVTLDRSAIVREANQSARALLEGERRPVVGVPLRMFVVPGERTRFTQHFASCRDEGLASTRLHLGRPDGSSISVEIISHRGPGFRDVFPTALIDLREREQAEVVRAGYESHEKALHEERAEREQLIAIVSHELRGPLAAMLTATEALEGSRSPREMAEITEIIRRNALIEARLIDDLLDATRIARGKMSMERLPIDVHQAVRESLDMFRAEISKKQLQVTVSLEAERYTVEGDPTRLRQVLWNLIKNAIKFTQPAGRIDLHSWCQASAVMLEVRDSGRGIEPHVLPRLFRAFEQGPDRRGASEGGLGLGLAISRGIVELHRGRIVAFSAGAGQGARFLVELPLLGALPRTEAPLEAPRPSPRSAARILLVEDNPDMSQALAIALGQHGYQVAVAESGAAAMQADLGRIDVVVSDLGLPDGNGHDLLRALRRRAQVRAIALSGYGTEDDLSASREAGFITHLTKPVDIDTLTGAIEASLAQPPAPALS